MLLRPRQQLAADRCVSALEEHGNTMLVAATGAGKTVMMSAVVASRIKTRALILQHRDELVHQNRTKFKLVSPSLTTGQVDAKNKQWDRKVIFGMVQTVVRNLDDMPPLDIIAIDEGHHTPADSYQEILTRAVGINPNLEVFAVTATPDRSDGRALRDTFDNVADEIGLVELIMSGHLVRPRTFVIDLGNRAELLAAQDIRSEQERMKRVEEIMDKDILHEKIFQEWKDKAGDRKTVFFASTVKHAEDCAAYFNSRDVLASTVHGELSPQERARRLHAHDQGQLQVLFNAFVLTEGYDSQIVSCVGLLRPMSHKSTMIQMIGRGLRTVDPELYPGVVKNDCIVLDFGTSILTHGSLEQDFDLFARVHQKGEAPRKECPICQAACPPNSFTCALCGYVFIVSEDSGLLRQERGTLTEFTMTEVNLLEASPFRWEKFFDDKVQIANALDAWGMILFYRGVWYGLGAVKDHPLRLIAQGERMVCLATTDDFLREFGNRSQAKKTKTWLNAPMTDKQMQILGVRPEMSFSMDRYRASCAVTWAWNEKAVKNKIQNLKRGV